MVDAKKRDRKPISEVRDEIERNLTQQERKKAQDRWFDTLREKAYIKILRNPRQVGARYVAARKAKDEMKPTIGITCGDPAGVGPEVIRAALTSGALPKGFDFRVIGDTWDYPPARLPRIRPAR